jgi:hypothetical protein
MLLGNEDETVVLIDMKKRRKKVRPKESTPDQDHFLMRIKRGELLYKFYYFRPVAGRHYSFEYRILAKEKASGMLEMVSYNFKVENVLIAERLEKIWRMVTLKITVKKFFKSLAALSAKNNLPRCIPFVE